MKASLKTLREMAARLGATTDVLREKSTPNAHCVGKETDRNSQQKEETENKRVAEVLVRKLRKDDREDQESVVELRLAVTGGQDAGKSTLLGQKLMKKIITNLIRIVKNRNNHFKLNFEIETFLFCLLYRRFDAR